MADPKFTWTDRARPVAQIGLGDTRVPAGQALWDQARWDAPTAIWSGDDPTWVDVSCDVRSFTCEYGRLRSIDRYVPGVARVVVDNSTGWADPNTVYEPGVLTMRPGRAIRLGVQHAVFGTCWLFRGFIDAMIPEYLPTENDTVTFECLDALGEINRAKLIPVVPPILAGQTVDQRIIELLNRAKWPTTKREIDPASDTLIESDMGGQLADLLGQAAESNGGSIFGDLDANVVYRGRDWQMFVPGTPPDGTIGNVEHGHTIPRVPQVDGYLNTTLGTVSTPDTADMTIAPGQWFRFTNRAWIKQISGTLFPTMVSKVGSGFANREFMVYVYQGNGAAAWSTTNPQLTANVDGGIYGTPGPPTTGPLTWGFEAAPGSTAYVMIRHDGRFNNAVGVAPLFPDSAAPVVIGHTALPTNVYWSQLELINRRAFMFPGAAGNYMTVPDSSALNITGDIEIIARIAPTDWTPAAIGNIVGKDTTGASQPRSWSLGLGTNGTLRLSLSNDGGATSTTVAGAVVPGVDGAFLWVRVTRVAATGLVSFYSAPDAPTEPTTWTARGTASTTAGSLTNGAWPVRIAARLTGATDPFQGRIARVIIRNGIAGPAVLDVAEANASTVAPGATSFTSSDTGNRYTYFPPGAAGGNNLTVPDAAPLRITGDLTIVAKITPTVPISAGTIVGRRETSLSNESYRLDVLAAGHLRLILVTPPTITQWVAQSTVPITFGVTRWVAATFDADNGSSQSAARFWTSSDGVAWTQLGTTVTGALITIAPGTSKVEIGTTGNGTQNPFIGRIERVIIRNGIAANGDPTGGTTVLDFNADTNLNNVSPAATSFALTTGGTATVNRNGAAAIELVTGRSTVTVAQTLLYQIIQPLPDVTVWRFDANDYPGTGTSYVDPRGRTWTLTAAGAITPKVPEVPAVVVPADVCPVSWDRPFARVDMATRVIIGRDILTALQFDDEEAQLRYGIEPFERVDLLTASDLTLETLGLRILDTRSADSAPRVRAVRLDARTSDEALDLMATVDVYRPSRYRCRLLASRGLVFDAEHFATGVAHEVSERSWTLALNLDLASPYEAGAARWDINLGWDRSLWSTLTPTGGS